jgi:hypothetical protein
MELNIAFFAVGTLIILSAIWRHRKYSEFKRFQRKLYESVWKPGTRDSINGELNRCVSHEWVMRNISQKTSISFQDRINDFLGKNTMAGFLCIAVVLGSSSLLLVMVFIGSIITTGVVVIVFFVGLAIAIGPGTTKTSQELVSYLIGREMDELNQQDVVYVSIAIESLRRWIGISATLGIVFALIAPFGDSVPALIAEGVSLVTWNLFLQPAFSLSAVSIGLSIAYLALAIPFFFYVLLLVSRLVISRFPSKINLPAE